MADSYTVVNSKDSLNVAVANTVPVQGALKVGDTVIDANPEMRPILLGAKATSSVAQRTLVADSRMMGLTVTPDGRLITLPYGGPTDVGLSTPVAAPTNGHTTDFALVTARAAGVKIALLGLVYANTGSVANQTVIVKSPTLGELGRFFISASYGTLLGPFSLPLKGGAAEAMNLRLTSAVAGATDLYFTPIWYSTKD